MVRSRYPYLLQQRRRWFVRMVVPPDVRDIIGQSIFKVPTGHTDEHRAADRGGADHRRAAATDQDGARGRDGGWSRSRRSKLAERYRAERETDPEKAEITKITDVIDFVLKHARPHLGGSRQTGARGRLRRSRGSPAVCRGATLRPKPLIASPAMPHRC